MTGFHRVGMYKGRVIITNGEVFMRFWSERRYPSLAAIRAAVDREVKA